MFHETFPLFTAPQEFEKIQQLNDIQVLGNILVALENNRTLHIFSLNPSSFVLSLSNVKSFALVPSDDFLKTFLIVQIGSSVSVYYTDSSVQNEIIIPEDVPIEKYDTQLVGPHFYRLIQFSNSNINSILIGLSPFQFLATIINNINGSIELQRFSISSQGIFPINVQNDQNSLNFNLNYQNCSKYIWNGTFISGINAETVHIWSNDLLQHIEITVPKLKNISSFSQSEIAILTGQTILFADISGLTDRKEKLPYGRYACQYASFYPGNHLFILPKRLKSCNNDFDCPIFFNNKNTFYTIDHPYFIQNSLSRVPTACLIQSLAKRGCYSVPDAEQLAFYSIVSESFELVDTFLQEPPLIAAIAFIRRFVALIDTYPEKIDFATLAAAPVATFCSSHIDGNTLEAEFRNLLKYFNVSIDPARLKKSKTTPKQAETKPSDDNNSETNNNETNNNSEISQNNPQNDLENNQENGQEKNDETIPESELIATIVEAAHAGNYEELYPKLQVSYPEYEPETLFKSLIAQQAYLMVVNGQLEEAKQLFLDINESGALGIHSIWLMTTRNDVRTALYRHLKSLELLTQGDEECAQILAKIASKFRPIDTKSKVKAEIWEPLVEYASTFNEKDAFIFPHLFNLPEALNSSFTPITSNHDVSDPNANNNNSSNSAAAAVVSTLATAQSFASSFLHSFSFSKNSNANKSTVSNTANSNSVNTSNNSNTSNTSNNSNISNNSNVSNASNTSNNSNNSNTSKGSNDSVLSKVINRFIDGDKSQFIGNVQMVVGVPNRVRKLLNGQESLTEKLWLLHCEHKLTEMSDLMKSELQKLKPGDKPRSLKFANRYLHQMTDYERETLLDVLCQFGLFVESEYSDTELLLVRICKNKLLFDSSWFSKIPLKFDVFFKRFARFCASKELFMPLEMFIAAHPRCKDVDLSDVTEPMVQFIWHMWVKRDPGAATLDCASLIAGFQSESFEELLAALPPNSLAPLASYVWNKDPEKFKPGSPETELLAARLQQQYPLLAELIKGNIPHPETPKKEEPPSKWRNPIWTSKYDLELHDLVASHFDYDFSKVFTNYYGPFPHFDHPELIKVPIEPPYIHYVRALLPVSAFQQATEDGLTAEQLRQVCVQCLESSLVDTGIRLASLTFIELTDLRNQTDYALDYKLCVSLYDRLTCVDDSSNEVVYVTKGSKEDTMLKDDLIKIFSKHDQTSAKKVQGRLATGNLEVLILSTFLGVRCSLPLDYSAISIFAKRGQPAQLLLFLDRAAEIGADFENSEIVKIITNQMPENPLKEHLIFHFTKTLPPEPPLQESEIPPALVVYRAIRRTDVTPETALLLEASDRATPLYAVIAASLDNSNQMMCALVALLTMSDSYSFSIQSPPPHHVLLSMLLSAEKELLEGGKEKEVMKILSLFSEKSLVNIIAQFYVSVKNFTFRQAEIAASSLQLIFNNSKAPQITNNTDNNNGNTDGNNDNNINNTNDIDNIDDDAKFNDELLGEVQLKLVLNSLLPLIENLTKYCAQRSQVHLFRYLELLGNTVHPPSLDSRIKLAYAIRGFEDFRSTIVKTDLLGNEEEIVTTFAINHSLELAQAAASALGISADHATQKWLRTQYETATTPAQVLEVHARVVGRLTEVDPLFFIALFATLLPYAHPLSIIELLKFARLHLKNLSADSDTPSDNQSSENSTNNTNTNNNRLTMNEKELQVLANELDALMLFVGMEDFKIEMMNEQHIPTQSETLRIILPSEDIDIFPNASLELQSPVLFGINALKQYFDSVVDLAIQKSLDSLKIQDARLIIEWRKKSSNDIILLEAVAKLLTHEPLAEEEKKALSAFGDFKSSDTTLLLEKIASLKGAHFKLLSLESKAASILSIPLEFDPEKYISSPLSLQFSHQPLINELILVSKIGPERTSKALALSYFNFLTSYYQSQNNPNNVSQITEKSTDMLDINDFGEKFIDFAKMCGNENLVGNELTKLATIQKVETKVALQLLLHASIISKEIEDISQKIDLLYKDIPQESIVRILTIFKAPELLPKIFEKIVKEGGLSRLPHDKLPPAVGHAILNTVRHIQPFEPSKYFDLTLQYKLYREYAELHMESGQMILSEIAKKAFANETEKISKLDASSKHYLIALAYFLHVKCFSLAMSCLKKLALTSIQHDLINDELVGLPPETVLNLMCTHDLPYALTIALAYDLDNDDVWSKVLYEQTIAKQNDQFLTAFQYFRPLSSKLCTGLIKQYKEGKDVEGRESRLKAFILHVPNLVERYRIAKDLNLNDQIEQMKESNPVVCEWCEKVLLA